MILDFSNHQWSARMSQGPTAPGNNIFARKRDNLFIDSRGFLHMKIRKNGQGLWEASEIINRKPLGYGTYTIKTVSSIDSLDKNAVFGFFTFESRSDHPHFREIDIEFSRWGTDHLPNAQFSVQPSSRESNKHRFEITQEGDFVTHSFTWLADSVHFVSYHGHDSPPVSPDKIIAEWTYRGPDIPAPRKERLRLNFWLYQGKPPSSGQDQEIILKSFQFSARE